MVGALCAAIVTVVLKKLCIDKVHYSIPVIYTSYAGLPVTLILSVVLVLTGVSHGDFQAELKLLPLHIVFVLLASFTGLAAQVLVNLALQYEDALVIAILKTFDVFMTFLLQYIFLNIKVDVFSFFGSFSIILGAFSILAYRLFEDYDRKNANVSSQRRCGLFFKFLKFKF
jgi:drug/metabolite transporter (DMT)-like permease